MSNKVFYVLLGAGIAAFIAILCGVPYMIGDWIFPDQWDVPGFIVWIVGLIAISVTIVILFSIGMFLLVILGFFAHLFDWEK